MTYTRRRRLTGRVVSNKMQETIIVVVQTTTRHPLYGKTMKARKRYKVHDQGNTCGIGDLVRITESRPISKDKSWVVEEIIERGPGE